MGLEMDPILGHFNFFTFGGKTVLHIIFVKDGRQARTDCKIKHEIGLFTESKHSANKNIS